MSKSKNFFGEVRLTYSCGHIGFGRLKCKMDELEEKKSELEKSLCSNCDYEYKNFKSLERARELNFVELFGTDKQIAWASRIKFDLLKSIKIAIISNLLLNVNYYTYNYRIKILSEDTQTQLNYFNDFKTIIENAISLVEEHENNPETLAEKKKLFLNLLESLLELKSEYEKILTENKAQELINIRNKYNINLHSQYERSFIDLVEY